MKYLVNIVTKILLALVVVAALCFGLYYSFQVSMERQRQGFETDALTVSATYRSAMDVVDAIATSLSVVHPRRPETQDSFAKALVANYPFITGYGRFRKLSDSGGQVYEVIGHPEHAHNNLLVWKYDESGNRVLIQRNNHHDVQHLYPVTVSLAAEKTNAAGDEMLRGFDLGSLPVLRDAVERATEYGKTELVSSPVQWPNPGRVLAVGGLYRGGQKPDNNDLKNKRLIDGYWLEIDFNALGNALELVESRGMGLSFTLGDDMSEYLLGSSTELHSVTLPESGLLFSQWLAPHSWISSFSVAGRSYTISLLQQRGMTTITFLYWLFSVTLVLTSLAVIAFLNARRIIAVKKQRQQSEALFLERQREAVTLLHISDAVISTDIDQRIEYVNKVAADMLDVSADDIVGMPIQPVFSAVSARTLEFEMPKPDDDFYQSKTVVSRDRVLKREDGSIISVSETISPVYGSMQQRTGSVVVLRDVTAEKEFNRQLEYQINHDPLTGLPNRLNFEARMRVLLSNENKGKFAHALCLIDLDRFKQVNDTCGHAAGDKLLVELADALGDRIRAEDLLARLGGDEFAVIIEHCDLDAAHSVAKRLHHFFNSYHFEFDQKVFPVRASIGLVHFDPAEVDLKAVSLAADTACYKAKDSGRNAVHIYSDVHDAVADSRGEQLWLPRLEHAIETEGFILHAQPLCGHADGVLSAPDFHEILLRLKDEETDGGLIHPLQFLKSAERYGLMRQIDEWVIRSTVKMIATLPESYSKDVFSINLSSSTLEREDLPEFLGELTSEYAVDVSRLCFEVTEESLLNNFETAKSSVTGLKALGCHIALDDFGVGVSSLSSFRELELDFLKIDMEFINGIENSPSGKRIVRSIHSFAGELGLKTIAEHIETKEALDCLCEIGVDYMQGYYIALPAPLAEYHHMSVKAA